MTSPTMKQTLHGIVRQKIMRKATLANDPDDDLDESGRRRASVATTLGFGGSSPNLFDGRGRFASLATAALETCRENEASGFSERGNSPRSQEKKQLRLSLSTPPLGLDSQPKTAPQSVTPPPTATSTATTPSPVRPSSPTSASPDVVVQEEKDDGKGVRERTKSEEEIYQQGFEEGVRSQISQELSDLRDQQRVLCDNLEEIMEAADESEEEEHTKKKREALPVLKLLRQYSKTLLWTRATRLARLFVVGILFFLALVSIIGTVLPLESCQGGFAVFSSPWEGMRRFLEPHTGLYHPRPPPT